MASNYAARIQTDGQDLAVEINAITLATVDMARAVAFWEAVGLGLSYGGPESSFSTLAFGSNFVNLVHDGVVDGGGEVPRSWGRVVFHVTSPDALWRRLSDAGYTALAEPADAPWGERYFHILDPDGHELSFARKLTEIG